VTIWLDGVVPEPELLQKADKLTGGGLHLAHVDLAFPPTPLTADDAARYDALRAAVADGRSRWDAFDVELPIATKLEGALSVIDVIRDDRDRDDLINARIFQGAAASKAFEPREFLDDERAAPFREELPGVAVNRPWLFAMMLAPDRVFTKADLGDGPVFSQLEHYQQLIGDLAPGAIDLSGIPQGATVVVDGVALDPDATRVDVRPGEHYVHLLRNGRVSGRMHLNVAPGVTEKVPLGVDALAVEQARVRVISGATTGFPKELKEALDDVMAQYPGPVFVAAVDTAHNDRITVLPYARNAQIIPPRAVTMVVSGELGAGFIRSSLFANSIGTPINAGAIDAGFQLELGVYNAVLLAGSDLAITPSHTTRHAAPGGQQNLNTPVLIAPYGGLGAYVLRPNKEHVTVLIAGTYGWDHPAHMTIGGRLALGIPLNDHAWFRLDAGIKGASAPMGDWKTWLNDAEAPLSVKLARMGFASRF